MAIQPTRITRSAECPELHSGDRMTRAEFHRIYERMPKSFKAELIGGIVYVASPLRLPHGSNHPYLGAVVTAYAGHTPGVEVNDNTTVFLGEEGEPQPDLSLRILPEYGGRSRTTADEYIEGPPEWISEIAHSSKAIDLHFKKEDYQRNGVLEYLVMCVKEKQLRWFDLQADEEVKPDADGIYRMRSFPGLWIHGQALFARDYQNLMKALAEGLATAEHQAFVQKLASQYRRAKKGGRRKTK
jgi:Uma2 family endonuclease